MFAIIFGFAMYVLGFLTAALLGTIQEDEQDE